MAINIAGLASVVIFYIIIFVIGFLAGRNKPSDLESKLLANRKLGTFLSSCSFTAGMVGGAYILGTAEAVGRDGTIWTVVPICYNIGMLVAAFCVAPKMRVGGYTTIFDPLQNKYGKRMGAFLFVNELLASVFLEAAILGALGSSLVSIIEVNFEVAVVVSASVAVTYTFIGGLYSVSYTDIIQIYFLTTGLILVTPFVCLNDAVDLGHIRTDWTGTLPTNWIGHYIDLIFVCICGGIPWAGIHQVVLASKSLDVVRKASLISAALCMCLIVPPSLVGLAGAATDWNKTSYPRNSSLNYKEWAAIFPLALRYLCPSVVSIVGLGAISAAVMSSLDTISLATAGVLTKNIYHSILRPSASEREILWALRVSVLIIAALGVIIALTVRSVYALLVLCGDLMYVAHFPQFICALWLKPGNTYGSLGGFLIGISLRMLGGEPSLSIPPVMKYPLFDEGANMQLFPFRTLSMACSFSGLVIISYLTNVLFRRNIIGRRFDFFNCFPIANQEDLTQSTPLAEGNVTKTDLDINETHF